MDPFATQPNAVRTVLLPLDCPQETLNQLVGTAISDADSNWRRLERYGTEALRTLHIDPTQPAGITDIPELGTFAVLTALRIQRAEPLTGTAYEKREPAQSAERRMLQTPLWNHPGLSLFAQRARTYYIATLLWQFENQLPPTFQSEIAAILFAPDPGRQDAASTQRVYAAADPGTVYEHYRDRIEIQDDGSLWLPRDQLSRCCQIRPREYSHVMRDDDDNLPLLTLRDGGVVIPRQVVRLKLAEYAWHGWARLVHTAVNTIPVREIDRVVRKTSNIDDAIYDRYHRNNTIYETYYGSETDNPRREWAGETPTEKPVQIEDKRLITIVDCLRASSDLHFSQPIPVDVLFDQLRYYFPPPHRPGNDIETERTLRAALNAATASSLRVDDNQDQTVCRIPPPTYTPIYPATASHVWDQYLHARTRLRRYEPGQHVGHHSRTGSRYRFVYPQLPRDFDPAEVTSYTTVDEDTQRAAATRQFRVSSIADVGLPPEESIPSGLRYDEVLFLMRVGFAMERLINDVSLTDSMGPLRTGPGDTQLDIDVADLDDREWVERHDEGRRLLYTVPAQVRQTLGIENTSHDGYGEITPAEKALHRKGVDLTAKWLSTKPDVTRVVRYCDLWRVQATNCAHTIQAHDLTASRIDVLAFHQSEPRYAAEIETRSNAPERARQCVQKLAALSKAPTMHTTFVTPSSHLRSVLQHVDHPEYFDFSSFPSPGTDYSRSTWEDKLQREDILGQFFDALQTYRSLQRMLNDSSSTPADDIVVGNI